MLHKNVTVKRPAKTKKSNNGKYTYVNFVTETEYVKAVKGKHNGYTIDKHRKCVGRLVNEDDDTIMYPSEQYYKYFPNEVVKEKAPEFSDALHIATVALLQKIMDKIKVSEVLDNVYGEEAAIIKDLICYVIIKEASVMQHYPSYAFDHMGVSNKVFDDTNISDLFKNRIRSADIEEFQVQWNQVQTEKSKIYISYDSTNVGTRAEGIEMAEFGHAKDNPEIPQVNIGYAIKHSDSTPLFYELYPGSIIDNTHCKYMVDSAKGYGYDKVGFIIDRGQFSLSNILYFDDNEYDFVMMVKLNSKMIEKHLKESMIPLRVSNKYYIDEHEVFGLTIEGKLFEADKKKRCIHIYYDSRRGNEERINFLKQINKKERLLAKKVAEKIRREEDLLSFKQHFILKFDVNGYLERYSQNEASIKETTDNMGFFVLITSEKMTAEEALSIYRDRDASEKMFDTIKTGFGYDTFRIHSQESLEAKTHIMFIASIVRNHVFQTSKENYRSDRKNFTVPAILHELEKIMAIKDRGGEYSRRYALTAKQKKTLALFDIDEKYLNNVVKDLNKRMKQNKKTEKN